MAGEEQQEYKLSGEFSGHDGDVRTMAGVCVSASDDVQRAMLLSGSRDRMFKGWSAQPPADGAGGAAYWNDSWCVYDHPHWVSAVHAFRASEEKGVDDDYVATGCQDGAVRVYQLIGAGIAPRLTLTLSGHEGAVCSLSTLQDASETRLISGSWDGCAKI